MIDIGFFRKSNGELNLLPKLLDISYGTFDYKVMGLEKDNYGFSPQNK